MEVFDGFISAIASELKIKFNKDSEGSYSTKLEFENGRSQEVLITLAQDEVGDRIIKYYSIVGKLKKDSCELFKYALQTNTSLTYCAMGLLGDALVLYNSILLEDCDPIRFMKTLTYIAAKADELEELLIHDNVY